MTKTQGCSNYSDEEQRQLLAIVRDVLPTCKHDWIAVETAYNAVKTPGWEKRTLVSLRRKFANMQRREKGVWPTLDRQKALARLTAARASLLQFTWGFIDGKNYRVQQHSRADIQNAHYNGWLHAVYVTGTLCFSADGLIVWSKHNCPGSWNDSDTSLQFREKLMDPVLNPDSRYGVIADSAFPCSAEMVGRIMTPLKDGDLARLVPSVRRVARRKSKSITFVRQAAEWGMGSVEKVFHRLLHPLPYDKEKRKRRLNNLFRLANYRVRTVEVSQIRTTFVYGKVDNM